MIGPVAQTNVQLLAQLAGSDRYTAPDIVAVDRAYGLARALHPHAYRANGKPFVCHLVGTASIVAQLGERPDVVCAGLLHAAYAQGDFGPRLRRMSRRTRRELVAVVGDAVEEIVARYTTTPWTMDALRALADAAPGDPVDRAVGILRLANELEDAHDGALVVRAAPPPLDLVTGGGLPLLRQAAATLGVPDLAGWLDDVADRPALELPAEVRRPVAPRYVILPRSARHRRRALALDALRAVRRRARGR